MCWQLFPLFNSSSMCSSLAIVKFNLGFYVTWDSSSIYAKYGSCLRGKEHGQQVQYVCLVKVFIELWLVHVGGYVRCNVAWLHLVWVRVFASTTPPPDWVVGAPFGLRGTDVERGLKWQARQTHTVYGRWSGAVLWLHLVGGGIRSAPLPIDWVWNLFKFSLNYYRVPIYSLKERMLLMANDDLVYW